MLPSFLKILPHDDRVLLRMRRIVDAIDRMEPGVAALNDGQLARKTHEFRRRLDTRRDTLDSLLPEAFAVVREASRRVLSMRHYGVQMLGGIALHEGKIAEMRTGEGKTLASTLPVYLHALSRKGVHVVTVNDYLSERDAETHRPLFAFLGLTTAVNSPRASTHAKKQAYSADVTYGTNHEYGFDYLRDNMVYARAERVQRTLHFALIDEIDSVLIDEARTPLVIAGATKHASSWCRAVDRLVVRMARQRRADSAQFRGTGHYSVDERTHRIDLTERGLALVEEFAMQSGLLNRNESLYTLRNAALMRSVDAALRAHALCIRDVDYFVENGRIVIVDEHTGRPLPERRWSNGLHQAVEAKEDVDIRKENHTLASITFQNYFRLYRKLSGMTGTASSDRLEFQSLYRLDTVVVPPHRRPMRRDLPDRVYTTETAKLNAVVRDVRARTRRGQPVLVGAKSIEKSESISRRLLSEGIAHRVLNAKHPSEEAAIVAQAGRPNAVTIATGMAGRGTDIVLGGHCGPRSSASDKAEWARKHLRVLRAGGLHVIGTERHESRRIDDQLRGRSGRQGDAGSSRFYLSMQDSLIRRFVPERVVHRLTLLQTGTHVAHPWIDAAIAKAQERIEHHNFDARRQLLEYDDVCNAQRLLVYRQRNRWLDGQGIRDAVRCFRRAVVRRVVETHMPRSVEFSKVSMLQRHLFDHFDFAGSLVCWIRVASRTDKRALRAFVDDHLTRRYRQRTSRVGKTRMRSVERDTMLRVLDVFWQNHLSSMDRLRRGIHLRCYAQRDPRQEYRRESAALFVSMLRKFRYVVLRILSQRRFSTASLPKRTSFFRTTD